MYLSFYDLQKYPFQINADSEFVWLGEQHRQALAVLRYGILDSNGFLLLTGDVGTGKTTLVNALVDRLGDEVVVARVPDPGMKTIDFINYVSHAFHLQQTFVQKHAFLIKFETFLQEACENHRKVLLIIDECQRLSQPVLEEIRQLSNIERQERKLLNIFLIGQNEFLDILAEPANIALRQRIAFSDTLAPFAFEETEAMILHRLRVAGAGRRLFSTEAIRLIHDATGGIPRKINILCDHCLLAGYARGMSSISAELARKCAGAYNRRGEATERDGGFSAVLNGLPGSAISPAAAIADGPAEEEPTPVEGAGIAVQLQKGSSRSGAITVAGLLLLALAVAVMPSGNRTRFVLLAEQAGRLFHDRTESRMTSNGHGSSGPAGAREDTSVISMPLPEWPEDGWQSSGPIHGSVVASKASEERVQFYARADDATAHQKVAIASPPEQEAPTGVSSIEGAAAGAAGSGVQSFRAAKEQIEAVGTNIQDVVAAAGRSDEDVAEIYPQMEQYLDSREEQQHESRSKEEQLEQEQQVDPGKVIDWLLEERSR